MSDKVEKSEKPADPKPPAPVAAGPKIPVEKLAHERGMLPEFTPGVPPRAGVKVPPVHNPKFVVFARAKAFHQWITGAEMTAAEFDEAIKKSEGVTYR